MLQQSHRCLLNRTSQYRKNGIHGKIQTVHVSVLTLEHNSIIGYSDNEGKQFWCVEIHGSVHINMTEFHNA